MKTYVALAVVFAAVAAGSARPAAAEEHLIVPVEKIQWGPAPPILPPGAQIAVLDGNPAEKGPVVMRLKFPANYTIPPHWHSMTERIVVISGVFHYGMGESVDRAGSQPLNAGSFVSLPGHMHHYAFTKTPTVVQINLEGPFDLFYINPADDPQHKVVSKK
jgi:anti-sigma factor ChrR (cupin superfamily)